MIYTNSVCWIECDIGVHAHDLSTRIVGVSLDVRSVSGGIIICVGCVSRNGYGIEERIGNVLFIRFLYGVRLHQEPISCKDVK